MKFRKEYISKKIPMVVGLSLLVVIGVIVAMVKTMTIDSAEWMDLKRRSNESIVLQDKKPRRGNILSCDGQLMASSLPDYRLYIDFQAGDADKDTARYNKKDTLFHLALDSLSEGLARICGNMTAEEYKQRLEYGWGKKSRFFDVTKGYVLNFIQHNEVIKLPFFCESPGVSGLISKPNNNRRKKSFGSLAQRTLGEMYAVSAENRDGAKEGESDAISGLELAYDNDLKGTPGKYRNRRVRGTQVQDVVIEPIDGLDLVSTIDVSMQDICEKAMRDQIANLDDVEFGVAIVMEVSTGDVKAIVNLGRAGDGCYYELRNYALGDLYEPGSTFKTASLMVALDDGEIKLTDQVNTGKGIMDIYGSKLKDHNWARGGCGVIDVTHSLKYSSNIGVGRFIDMHYHKKPEKFVEGLKRIGIGTPLKLPFAGAADPVIRMPNSTTNPWSATTLTWMSIGYETQIPLISTCAFYNAIANNGKLVQPRFAKGLMRNGEMTEEFPVNVLREHICKDKTLEEVREMLRRVVNDPDGVGKHAKSKHFVVAGKTGTAQVAAERKKTGKTGYAGGQSAHLVSFCGFFPFEAPKYTCLIAFKLGPGYASGGQQAGPVFLNIAEKIYSKDVTTALACAADTTSQHTPIVKAGDIKKAKSALDKLNISNAGGSPSGNDWGTSEHKGKQVFFNVNNYSNAMVPDLSGMGARDAVYAIESRGMRARITGAGKVISQSVAAGTKVSRGKEVIIELGNAYHGTLKSQKKQQDSQNEQNDSAMKMDAHMVTDD